MSTRKLYQLKVEDLLSIAEIIDNNFIGNRKIIIHERKIGDIRITGHTIGKQCINCDVKIDIANDKLNLVSICDEDGWRQVTQTTLTKVENYLKDRQYEI